ncbi:hypothetical protein D1AOALGA4SA_5244 [Olavius algarvensis Delta 1 endosymbiont]|nr:hypothetical protein D1AOALGA4SA_5244 [Olavius algarvensis Delta 1 endosymbiont]
MGSGFKVQRLNGRWPLLTIWNPLQDHQNYTLVEGVLQK